jgi:hypothetical protein
VQPDDREEQRNIDLSPAKNAAFGARGGSMNVKSGLCAARLSRQ